MNEKEKNNEEMTKNVPNEVSTKSTSVDKESAPAVASTEVTDNDSPAVESMTQSDSSEMSMSSGKSVKWQQYAVAIVAVVIILGGILYAMEKQGRIDTGLFGGLESVLSNQSTIASVNGNKISQYELTVSMNQIEAGAVASEVDVTDPDVQAEIQAQAVEMLVNTELLKQEATRREITITDEAVQTRLTSLQEEVGGVEVLETRMEEFSIDQKTLLRDIKNELTIQALLAQVFAERNIEITDEEVMALYEAAGGVEAGLPDIDELRPQIEAQIRTNKEQEIVTALIEELKAVATIEILI